MKVKWKKKNWWTILCQNSWLHDRKLNFKDILWLHFPILKLFSLSRSLLPPCLSFSFFLALIFSLYLCLLFLPFLLVHFSLCMSHYLSQWFSSLCLFFPLSLSPFLSPYPYHTHPLMQHSRSLSLSLPNTHTRTHTHTLSLSLWLFEPHLWKWGLAREGEVGLALVPQKKLASEFFKVAPIFFASREPLSVLREPSWAPRELLLEL